MAIYGVQYIKHAATLLPKDAVVTTLHFDTTEPDPDPAVASAIAGYVAAAHYDAKGTAPLYLEEYIAASVSRTTEPTIKVYDASAPGSPLAVEEQVAMRAAGGTGQSMPAEVACCLSFRGNYGSLLEEAGDDGDADSAPERPRSRVRGRIFEGPFISSSAAAGATSRPDVGLRNALLDFAQRLYNIRDVVTSPLVEVSPMWVVYSRDAGAATEVVRAWVDDAWDTQRRRGVAASARSELVF